VEVGGSAVEDTGGFAGAVEEQEGGDGRDVTEGLGRGGVGNAQWRSGLSELTMERIWSSGDSTAKARMAMSSPCLRFSSPNHSRVERQGGHQVAQNSTRTTRPES